MAGDARRASLDEIREIQRAARARATDGRPALADDRAAHARRAGRARRRSTASRPRAPAARTRCRSPSLRDEPRRTSRQLEQWLRSLPPRGAVRRERRAACPSSPTLAPERRAPDGREPARERRPAAATTSSCRTSATTPSTCRSPATETSEATRVLGAFLRDVMRAQPDDASGSSVPTRPSPIASAPSSRPPTAPGRPRSCPTRRPPRARRPGHGGAQRAPVPGLARGLPAHRPPRAVQLLRGVHPHRRLDVQPAREVAEGHARHPVAAPDRLAELPALARTSGARTTTASPTRTRGSSTTS